MMENRKPLDMLHGSIWNKLPLFAFPLTGKALLYIFNNDPQVISVGYTRLIMVFFAYTFSMLYENMSGYMRGFGFYLIPAIVTTLEYVE